MRLTKISENLHIVSGMFVSCANDCTSYLLKGEGGAVMIDCGSGEAHERVMRNMDSSGAGVGEVSLVIGTHGHYDHLAGLEKLRGENPSIKLAMHEEDAGQIESGDPDLTCAGWFFGEEMSRQAVDVRYSGGERFSECGIDFEIVSTPGHTPGSICIRAEIDGMTVLFTGDALSPGNEIVRSDRAQWERTLRDIADMEFDAVLPGHANHFVMEPFCMTLAARKYARGPAEAAYNFLLGKLAAPIWAASVFNYTHITPRLTRIGKTRG